MSISFPNAASQYGQVDTYTRIETANQSKLVEMLFEGLLQKLSAGKAYMHSREVSKKGTAISKAIDIIGGLKSALNQEAGGDIARNLDALYDYMQQRLLTANLESDPGILEEVITLVLEIKEAWAEVSKQYQVGNNYIE